MQLNICTVWVNILYNITPYVHSYIKLSVLNSIGRSGYNFDGFLKLSYFFEMIHALPVTYHVALQFENRNVILYSLFIM